MSQKWSRNNGLKDLDICVGCSMCVENRPKDCLEIEDAKSHDDIDTIAFLKDPKTCIECGICTRVCLIDAIELIKTKDKKRVIMFTIAVRAY
ncbi:MAG: 4Fe-4S dicluster domain-containing protein [Eggerthellaceae bacterium]|nr:4Fe-4S dicluster domain-containing protein [Eggerthellaceae bacterium]